MSRVGQIPVAIPDGVTVSLKDGEVCVKGPNGELTQSIPGRIQVVVEDSLVKVTRPDESRESKSFHGLVRSLIGNMVEGVTKGYSRELEIQGVGFKAEVKGQILSIAVGFASPVEHKIPDGISIKVDGGTKIEVSGPDKQMVGETAARIRGYSPAEPYKGKGILYKGEHIRRKVGKTVA